MPMPQEMQAKKHAIKKIKEYARSVEAEKMKQPTLVENMEQADSEAPSQFASQLDPAKAVKKSIPPSALENEEALEGSDQEPNEMEGDVTPHAQPSREEQGSPMEAMDRDALIAEYEKLSKKRQ